MRISRALAIIALACGIGWAQAALAADEGGTAAGDKPVVEKLLDIMLKSGQISPGQYDELLEQSRQEQKAAAVAGGGEGARPTDWKFKWSNGFKLDRNDAAFKLKFGGRIMTDAALIWEGDGLESDFTALGTGSKDGSGVEFRRARLFFEGTVYEQAFFKAQYEFANTGDGKTDFKDVYLGLKKLGPVRDVRIGHFKEPFMLQEMTSSKYITFMERGLNNVFFPGRNVGIMATGTQLEKKLQWQVGFFNETNDEGFSFDEWDESQFDVAARLAGAPLYAEGGEEVVHLGVGYIHQFRDKKTETARYKQRPEAHLAGYWADTQGFAADDGDILNLEFANVWGPLSLQSEFTYTWVEGGPGIRDSDLWGLYAEVSWFLTGEHRPYALGKGSFGRVKPKKNFNPAQGDWGAWQIAARYSYLDLDDKDLSGGKLWSVTAGLNWYLYPNLRLMFNYVHADVDDRVSISEDDAPVPSVPVDVDGKGDIFQIRAQIDF